YIKSTGFYKNKALNLKANAKILIEKYNGVLPRTMEELIKLPGVGRKTANVLLGDLWGIREGIVVNSTL
ncbi:endonuclease III domain-containing protein, partial [Streptobacillus moniliformis]|uniref:endonuclease III domain-containing protein n=1 Tax=Streptobacillus moniliformis TaxID=34105 RepID=UPI000ACBCEB8